MEFVFLVGKVDMIFFEDDSDNLNETPKFDGNGHDFVEEKLFFGRNDFVIEVISHSKSPRMYEEVVGDVVVKKNCGDKSEVRGDHTLLLTTDDTDDELVVDIFQDFHAGVFIDNMDLSVEVLNIVHQKLVPTSGDDYIQIVFK
ncbi:hypothetical protein Scep_013879 [Stephania cephalantha]|uniref:Uncharacterized protein n=1 Tax=Stephania cephalantha TaxID=152367 RepID=A0AAP0NZU1_9MAGN